MQGVNNYIDEAQMPERAVLQALHSYLTQLPGISVKINYGIPFYYRNSWICYLSCLKQGGVEIAFTRANELSNEQGLLDFRNRKQIAGIILHDIHEIRWTELREILQEALLLDDTVKYTVRKKK